MPADALRGIITNAVADEQRSHTLQRRITARLPELQEWLILPETGAAEALVGFITEYVEAVPSALALVGSVSKPLGFHPYVAPFLYLAEDFFLHPPDGSTSDGLESVLQEAFLAHRLLEEVNDHHVRHRHQPLLPVDMTEANIIVHYLLGDTRASRLEQLVNATATLQIQKGSAWTNLQTLPGSSSGDLAGEVWLQQGRAQPEGGLLARKGAVRLRLARSPEDRDPSN